MWDNTQELRCYPFSPFEHKRKNIKNINASQTGFLNKSSSISPLEITVYYVECFMARGKSIYASEVLFSILSLDNVSFVEVDIVFLNVTK